MNFSTNEAASLEKQVDLLTQPVETDVEAVEKSYEISRCIDWIKSNDFKTVCLQFPDHLLPDSSKVCLKLEEALDQCVYILGDTTYESCCIDYIAAAHINADAIIHFGPICYSKTSANISYLNIYEKYFLDIDDFKNKFVEVFQSENGPITILADTPYIYILNHIQTEFKDIKDISFQRIDCSELFCHNTTVFLGNNERKLINIQTGLNVSNLFYFDGDIKKFEIPPTILKRRHYLKEKIKDSKTIGILIGTLGVKNYLSVIDRIKILISKSSKKYYLINVGKPTVAKLANFPEMDIYVAVTCSMSEIYESRDFYTPIATPADVEVALNTNSNGIKFSYDYNAVLGENFSTDDLSDIEFKEDVSLLTNRIRSNMQLEEEELNAVALKDDGSLALNSQFGAGYLSKRSWKGLEQNLGVGEVEMATEGRSGIAQKYENETS